MENKKKIWKADLRNSENWICKHWHPW